MARRSRPRSACQRGAQREFAGSQKQAQSPSPFRSHLFLTCRRALLDEGDKLISMIEYVQKEANIQDLPAHLFLQSIPRPPANCSYSVAGSRLLINLLYSECTGNPHLNILGYTAAVF